MRIQKRLTCFEVNAVLKYLYIPLKLLRIEVTTYLVFLKYLVAAIYYCIVALLHHMHER